MSRLLFLLLLAAMLAPSAAAAHSHKKKGLEIVHPWTRATADKSVTTVMVSMTIKNRGSASDRLLGATTPLAARVHIREPGGDPSSGNTKAVAAVVIGAGKDLDLKRNGPHLLLSGVNTQLEAYGSFVMTLVFEKAGKVVVEVMVEETDEEPKPH